MAKGTSVVIEDLRKMGMGFQLGKGKGDECRRERRLKEQQGCLQEP